MTVKYLHSISSSDKLSNENQYKLYRHFLFIYNFYHGLVKHLIHYFFKIFYLSPNTFQSKHIFLLAFHHLYGKALIYCFLIYPLILGIIKTNGLVYLSEYPIKYLELVSVLINFGITILSRLTFQIFMGFFEL